MPAILTSASALAIVLAGILAAAVWFDVRDHRIPNWVTAGGAVLALAVRAFAGLEPLQAGLLGLGFGFAIGMALWVAGAMGAGDGKMLAAVGAAVGLDLFLLCLPLIGAAGGALALWASYRSGTLFATLLRFRELAFWIVTAGRVGERRTLATPGAVTVPYGVAVAAGAVMAWMGWGLTL